MDKTTATATATGPTTLAPATLQPATMKTKELIPLVTPLLDAAFEAGQAAAKDLPDEGACGFAWVTFDHYMHPDSGPEPFKLNGRSRLGMALLADDRVTIDWLGRMQIWGGMMYRGQSVDAIETAAQACAAVLRLHGFGCYVGSRLD